jgi:hypothetical protein
MELEIGKKMLARLPVVMSLVAFSLVVIQVVAHGFKPETDEGALAHLWQLLMVAQLPLIGWFAYRWLGRAPRQALTILFVQLLALAAAALPVFVLGL